MWSAIDAEHDADFALLNERRDAEAADAGRVDREVALLGPLELGRLPIVHDRAHQLAGVLPGQRLVGYRQDAAVDLERRRKFGRQKQVRALLVQQQPQQIVYEAGCLIAFHCCPCLSR